MLKGLISLFLGIAFVLNGLPYSYAQIGSPSGRDFNINALPIPGTMISRSPAFVPLSLKGLVVNPRKPLEFQFIIDTGKMVEDTASMRADANQLVKYFLAGLTIPEGELWVNLSPYEKNRITTTSLGQTELGRDLLAQDYILKQLTASLIYPEKNLGKEFWSRVYKQAQAKFGTTNVPVNTFNKVWILPDQSQVYEQGGTAYITKATLKVMLDEDYLALEKHQLPTRGHVPEGAVSPSRLPDRAALNVKATQGQAVHALASQIVRQIVIPEITKEVNTGRNFAPLRQIYDAMILAKWYKQAIQNGLLDALYTNKDKTGGVNLADPSIKEKIYERYIQAYKKGVFNYIKEDTASDGKAVPKKYFSGGCRPEPLNVQEDGAMSAVKADGDLLSVVVELSQKQKMLTAWRVGSIAAGLALMGLWAGCSQLPHANGLLNTPLGGSTSLDYAVYHHWDAKLNTLAERGIIHESDKSKENEFNPLSVTQPADFMYPPNDADIQEQLESLDLAYGQYGMVKLELGKTIVLIDRRDLTNGEDIVLYDEFYLNRRKAERGIEQGILFFSKKTGVLHTQQGVDRYAFVEYYLTTIKAIAEYLAAHTGDLEIANLPGVKVTPTQARELFLRGILDFTPSEDDVSSGQFDFRKARLFLAGAKPADFRAMLESMAQKPTADKMMHANNGGIDLNAIKISRSNQAIEVQFDPDELTELQENGFDGFSPVIIRMTCIANPLLLFTMAPSH